MTPEKLALYQSHIKRRAEFGDVNPVTYYHDGWCKCADGMTPLYFCECTPWVAVGREPAYVLGDDGKFRVVE